MKRISDALATIIQSNQFLRTGVSKRLFNLSKLADLLVPLIAARTKKDVSRSSVLMALSRYTKQAPDFSQQLTRSKISSITAQSDLVVLTYSLSPGLLSLLPKLTSHLSQRDHYFTLTQGLAEVTVIVEKDAHALTRKLLQESPKLEKQNICSLSVRFSAKLINQPGFLHSLLEQLTFQNINLVEVASTATEFILYLNQADITLAFDTLQQAFRG
jgi:aspartokinase